MDMPLYDMSLNDIMKKMKTLFYGDGREANLNGHNYKQLQWKAHI